MTIFPSCAASLILRSLRVGSLRIAPYGLCAAAGLLAGMSLARPLARRAGLSAEAAWDAGMFAIVSCFVVSRLLLVLNAPAAFLRFPLLLLSLPSLTFGGVTIAGLMLWVYLRRKRLPPLSLLDVYAVPAACLAGFLELGHALDGSEVGMPARLPWAVRDPWAATGPRVHPVAIYGVLLAVVLAGLLWWMLSRGSFAAGRVAAAGLFLGGACAFGLNLITQPIFVPPALWLEPGQFLALGSMLTGTVLWLFAPPQEWPLKRMPEAADAEQHRAYGVALLTNELHRETR